MSATIRADGFFPPHLIDEDDDLLDEEDDVNLGWDDIKLIVAIRERERKGRHASAEWLRAALGAIRSAKRANRYLEEAIENNERRNGTDGDNDNNGKNGRNGSTHR